MSGRFIRVAIRLSAGYWARASVRVFLVAALAWPGLIPCCHRHGTLANSPEDSSWLAAHLRTCHPAVNALADKFFGWHFHVYAPPSSDEDPNQPSRNSEVRFPPTSVSDSFSTQIVQRARLPHVKAPVAISHERALVSGIPDHSPQNAGHFYDHFADSLALPLRFCVLRT